MPWRGQLREAAFKAKRTVLPGSTFWNNWTKYPFSMTVWRMRPLGVQALALAYRTGEAWNESGYSNPDFDAKLKVAFATPDVEKRRAAMKDIEQILQDSGILVQPYWRSLFIHPAKAVQDNPAHPNLEMHFERCGSTADWLAIVPRTRQKSLSVTRPRRLISRRRFAEAAFHRPAEENYVAGLNGFASDAGK
jgi:ABC-type transport system substrate-binding protein